MNIIKFAVFTCLLAFVVINTVIPMFAIAGESEPQIGYGRGGRMSGGSTSARSDEPIQPIPINFDYDRAKVELGKKIVF